MRASTLAIPRGVQLRIEDFDAVEIQVERDASIEGEIVFPGGLLRIAAENIRLAGSIDVSGGRGFNGGDATAGFPPAPNFPAGSYGIAGWGGNGGSGGGLGGASGGFGRGGLGGGQVPGSIGVAGNQGPGANSPLNAAFISYSTSDRPTPCSSRYTPNLSGATTFTFRVENLSDRGFLTTLPPNSLDDTYTALNTLATGTLPFLDRVFRVDLVTKAPRAQIPGGPVLPLLVEIFSGNYMDWTPARHVRNDPVTNWFFTAVDLSLLKAKP